MNLFEDFIGRTLEVAKNFYSSLNIDKEVLTQYTNNILKCGEDERPTECLVNYIYDEFNKLSNDTNIHNSDKLLRILVLFDFAQITFPLILEKEVKKNSDKVIHLKELKNYELLLYGTSFLRKSLFQLISVPVLSLPESFLLMLVIYNLVTIITYVSKFIAESGEIVVNNIRIYKVIHNLFEVLTELLHSLYSMALTMLNNMTRSGTSTQII